MESSGPIVQVAHDVVDERLAALFEHEGPFLTVYVDTRGDVENAAQRLARRWKSLRDQLAADGADASVLDAVESLTDGAHKDGNTLAVVASAEGVLYAANEPEPPDRDLGRVAPLPSIAPLLEWRQSAPSHVAVLVDRTGADVVAFRRDAPDLVREVTGDDDVIRKVAGGGWSQRRFQQRAEDSWEKNAGDVAQEVAALVEQTNARIVVVAGDDRAVSLLRDALPGQVAALVRVVPGGRSPDGSTGDIADDVVRLVATAVAEDTVAILRKFREERGQGDRAADGARATFEALARGQVETLLVHDDPDDDRTAWFGPDPTHAALDARTLRDMGVEEPVQARLVDVAVRAAIGTGAGIWVVPGAGGPKDRIGALLRWSD